MGEATKIQWTDHTFNPWRGCSKVHTGCTNCYAETQQRRFGVAWGEVWQGGQRIVAADSTWAQPMKWARAAARAGVRRRVFCASLADVLEVPIEPPACLPLMEWADAAQRVRESREALDSARARLWAVIRQTAFICSSEGAGRCLRPVPGMDPGECADCGRKAGGLDWLLLTKRPEHWELVPEDVRPLVWLGTSISDQTTADEWVPRLLKAEGYRYRFLSLEPMVGPVNLEPWLAPERTCIRCDVHCPTCPLQKAVAPGSDFDARTDRQPVRTVDWVIVGGESGPKARPCAVEWVRDVVRQCREAAVPVFVKQLGGDPRVDLRNDMGLGPASFPLCLMDPKGGDVREFPWVELQVREVPRG